MVVIGSTFSVFFENILQETDWSRGQISRAFSIFLLFTVIGLPVIGHLTDRFGSRLVILPCVFVFTLSLLSFYFVGDDLYRFYAVFIVIGLVAGGTSTLPYFKVITRSFVKHRGLALGVANSGTGLGQFILPYLAFILIMAFGWRQAYAIIGMTVLFITVPLIRFCLNETYRDADIAGETPASSPGNSGLVLSQALSSRNFWLIGSAFFLGSTTLLGFLIHMAPLLTDRGLSAQTAALAVSAFGLAQFLGRLLTGVLLDRFFAPRLIACLWSAGIVIFMLLWSGAGGYVLVACAALLGFAWGGEGDVLGYMVGRYFGTLHFGSIYGVLLTLHMLGGVVGPWLMGAGFDALGSYTLILGGMAVLMCIATFLVLLMDAYPEHGDGD